MYKKILLLLLILTTMQIPLGTTTSSASSFVIDPSHNVTIDSMLKMELDDVQPDTVLAEDGGIGVILQFQDELSETELAFAEENGVKFIRRGSSPIHVGKIYSAQVFDESSLHQLPAIGLIEATPGSKQYYPALPSSVPAMNAPDVWNNMEKDELPLDGTGTTVAVIDTGAVWLHPTFWRASTGELNVISEGPDYYVDIDSDSVADSNEGPINTVTGQAGVIFDYADDYMFIDVDDNGVFEYDDGDRWIGGIDADDDNSISLNSENVVILGESKIALFYDQYSHNVYVRGVNLTTAIGSGDTIGHGTHVASTVAGGQIGMTSYVGVAPGADLIIVRSPLTSQDVLDGISFAVENDADVINMSFSSYLGFLDGTDLEDMAVSEAMIKNGTISTLAAGNLGDDPKHARFEVNSGEDNSANLYVSSPPDNSFLNLLWRSDNDDEHVILTPPGGEDIDLGAFSSRLNNPLSLEEDNISAYVFGDKSDRGFNRIILQISADHHKWDTGTWTITITNPSGDPLIVDGYAWDGSWGTQRLRFSSKVDTTHTISSPGTSDLGVTVSSYNEVTHGLSHSSSVGPRIDGILKPNVAAPGDSIRAAYHSLTNLWYSRAGTSMAAPHAAGAVALIKQAAGADGAWRALSALYQGAGGPDEHYDGSDSWGYGLCDPVWSIQHLLTPEDGPIYWDGIPKLEIDPNDDTISPENDMVSIAAYLLEEQTWFQVTMEGIPNLNTSDSVLIEWDQDLSMATGPLGIDVLVNITEGLATIYDWSGSAFSEIGVATWYNESNSIYLSLNHDSSDTHGRFKVSTGNSTMDTIDTTNTIALGNQWYPLVESIQIFGDDPLFNFLVLISDKDTAIDFLEVDFHLIDGGVDILDSDSFSSEYQMESTYNTSDYDTTDDLSVLLSITDSFQDFLLPPILLSEGFALEVSFLEAVLDKDMIRVGPFMTDRITGRVVLEGYILVEDVKLTLQPSIGLPHNVTLSGVQGVYEFDITPSTLAVTSYDVSVVVFDQVGGAISEFLGTITLVQDYSIAILIGGLGIGVLVLVYFGPKFLTKRKAEGIA